VKSQVLTFFWGARARVRPVHPRRRDPVEVRLQSPLHGDMITVDLRREGQKNKSGLNAHQQGFGARREENGKASREDSACAGCRKTPAGVSHRRRELQRGKNENDVWFKCIRL
jgi:hypothetical protein